MDVDIERIQGWLAQPREAINRELKAWIDPRAEADRMMLVKGMLAMRNRDGGMIAIGFENDPGQALAPPAATDWAAAYHVDAIQGLAGKHASQQYEIAVGVPA